MMAPDENVIVISHWREPDALESEPSRIPYPINALPPILGEAVSEVQEFVQAPTALVAASALSATALVSQPLVNVERAPGLTGPPSLFFLSIAKSGERKSASSEQFFQPIVEYESAERERLAPEMDDYYADLESWNVDLHRTLTRDLH